MKRRWGAFLWGVIVTVVIGWALPTLLSQALKRVRPSVSHDWVKARCFEFRTYGAADKVRWESVGPDRWYLRDKRFGARRLDVEGFGSVLIFAPDGDGRYAYALTGDGKVLYSHVDAASLGCDWQSLKTTTPYPNQINPGRWDAMP